MRWVLGLVIVVACSPFGATYRFCDRYLELVADMESGDITSTELERRLAPGALGEPEGQVGDYYQRLLHDIERGDEDMAVTTTYQLADLCLDVLANT